MKIAVFFLYIFLLLPSGGNSLYAFAKNKDKNNSFSSQTHIKKSPVKLSNNNQTILLFNETDIDIEEDYHSKDDANEGNTTILIGNKYTSLNPWYSSGTNLFILNYLNNRFEILPPFLGNSYPIYISQRALRI